MARPKLFLTDLDGTMVEEGGFDITPRYFEAIRALGEKGVRFAIASGRQRVASSRIFSPIADEIIYIVENGALITMGGETLFYRPMSKEDSEELVRDTHAQGGLCLYDTKEIAYFQKGEDELIRLMRDEMRYACEVVDDLLSLEIPACKFTFYHPEDAEEVCARSFTPKWSKRTSVACAGRRFMDVVHKEVNKGAAVRQLQEHLGIMPEETVCCGDNLNDLQMFAQSGRSYAVANARQEVQEAATHRAPSLAENGVLWVMEQLIKEL